MALFQKKEPIDFFDLLIKQCETCVKGIEELIHFMALEPGVEKQIAETNITGYEKEGDRWRKELILGVQDAFITPIDREDLFILSRRIDDVLDQVDEIKDLMEIFNVRAEEAMFAMAELCKEGMESLLQACRILETSESEKNLEYMMIAKKDENRVKRLYWKSILNISDSCASLSDALQTRELARELDQLANKIGRAADKMGEAKLKMIR